MRMDRFLRPLAVNGPKPSFVQNAVPFLIVAALFVASVTTNLLSGRFGFLVFVPAIVAIAVKKSWQFVMTATLLVVVANLWLLYPASPEIAHDNIFRALLFLVAGGAIAFTFQRQRHLQRELQKALELAENRLAAVETSESRYRLAFQGAQLGFAHLGSDNALAHINRHLAAILGSTVAELASNGLSDFFLPQDREPWAKAVYSMRAGASTSYSSEFELIRRDGGKVWVRLSMSALPRSRDADHDIFIVVEDISDRRKAREALRAEKEWLDLVLSAGRLGSWQIDFNNGTITGSRLFWKVVGMPPADSRTLDEISRIVHPGDWRKFLDGGTNGFSKEKEYDTEIRISTAGQGERWIALRGQQHLDSAGHLIRTGIAADITARRQTTLLRAAAKKQEYILLELRHRLSNLFPVIVSLVKMVDGSDSDIASYRESLIERIRALEATHSLLSRHVSGSAMLRDILLLELKPYRASHDVTLNGPAVLMTNGAAESFAMMVHELATNSVKHGALGDPNGRLQIKWTIDDGQPGGEIAFEWLETTARKVSAISRHGFGSSIIGAEGKPLIGHSAKLEMASDGFHYSLRLPRGGNRPRSKSLW